MLAPRIVGRPPAAAGNALDQFTFRPVNFDALAHLSILAYDFPSSMEYRQLGRAAPAVGGEDGAEALAFEENPDGVAQAVVVVNDENGEHRHGDFSAMGVA